MEKKPELLNQNEIKCVKCGAKLTFAPGTTSLICPYCNTENKIKINKEELKEALKEIDYFDFINKSQITEEITNENTVVKCPACGATTTLESNVISSECAYCGTPLIKQKSEIKKQLKPTALVPFAITKDEAAQKFREWIKKSFWVPQKAKQYSRPEKIQGLYTPYWTFDAKTITDYVGERGDDYEDTETFTNSEGETESRTVTKTDWTRVSGRVYVDFDDLLIVATKSLPEKYVQALSPWNLSELVPYNTKFLSGLKAETYSKDVKEGFEDAKFTMEFRIENEIKRDIGGDHQRIISKDIQYNDVTFKHVLLPIWISSYRFKGKVYRFVVNGQTGKVKGERPVSVGKIILVILIVAVIIAAVLYFSQT